MDRIFSYDFINRTPIPLWKWILLHFVKTVISIDIDANISTVCYAKKLFGVMYIWKIKTYTVHNGKLKLIKTERLTRKD